MNRRSLVGAAALAATTGIAIHQFKASHIPHRRPRRSHVAVLRCDRYERAPQIVEQGLRFTYLRPATVAITFVPHPHGVQPGQARVYGSLGEKLWLVDRTRAQLLNHLAEQCSLRRSLLSRSQCSPNPVCICSSRVQNAFPQIQIVNSDSSLDYAHSARRSTPLGRSVGGMKISSCLDLFSQVAALVGVSGSCLSVPLRA